MTSSSPPGAARTSASSDPDETHDPHDPDETGIPTASGTPTGRGSAERPARLLAGLSRWAQVLGVWAASTALSLMVLRLSAQDTGATPWAGAAPTWLEHMSFWDAGWYERITEEGYPSALPVDAQGRVAQNTWAFMPLLPLLAQGLGWATGWPFHACAAVVSIVSSAAAALAADWWLAPRTGRVTSLWAVALLWCSPCAPVLQVPYAEALGLALVTLALGLASRGRLIAAVPAAALAAFARPVGVPLAAAAGLWWAWEEAAARGWLPRPWSTGRTGLLPGSLPCSPPQRARLLVLALASGAAALGWPALAWAATGRADAYTATETAWRDDVLTPFAPWLARSGWWVGSHLGWLLLLLVVLAASLVLSAPALRRLGPGPWFWCVAYSLYLLAFFDPTTSLLRLLLPLAPLAWAAAATARTTRRRTVLLAACLTGQLFWVSWVWALGSVQIQWVP